MWGVTQMNLAYVYMSGNQTNPNASQTPNQIYGMFFGNYNS